MVRLIMKKILSCVIACGMLSQVSVFADMVINKNNCAYTVTIGGDDNETVTMMVVKKGESLADENIVAVREGKVNGENVVLRFEFENDPQYEGEYTLYAFNNDMEIKSETYFTHATDDSVSEASEWIENASNDAEILAMLEVDSDYRIAFQAMGMKLDLYDEISQKNEVVSMFLAEKNSTDDIASLMNKCIGTVMVNNGYDAEKALNSFAPSFEGTAFSKIADEDLKGWITELIEDDYENTSEFANRYEEINILYKFKNAKFSEFSKLFDKYEDKLGIKDDSGYEKYQDLSSAKKSDVGDELVKIQAKNPAETTKELLDNLDDAYDEAEGGKKSGSTGGGGGGGGSRTPNTGVNPGAAIVENKAEVKNEEIKFNGYTDIGTVLWAETAVNELTKKGIISGDGDGRFRPNDKVTREEFAKMLMIAIGKVDDSATGSFSDVDANAWYYKYVSSAFSAGIVNGISESEFGVGLNITRQEMATMTARALSVYKEASVVREDTVFADGDSISDWAKDSVNLLYRSGIMSGTDGGNFQPASNATRAQAAVVIYNLIK